LRTLITGGVAFYTPDDVPDRGTADEGEEFSLYPDYEKASEQGLEIVIRWPQGDGLEEGAPIKYQGITVGQVKRVRLSDDLKQVLVSAHLEPSGAKLARKGTRFWVVKPQLGITGAANLETLIKGHYIMVEPEAGVMGKGPTQYTFDGLSQAPVNRMGESGLNILISSPQRGSIKAGSKVLYRQMPVGEVKSVELADNAQSVLFYVNIEPRYAMLVHKHSVFWNSSGVEVDFGLFRGATVRTESLESILEGGIAFATPEGPAMGPVASPQSLFKLHDKPENAWLEWRPAISLGKASH
jgi:paraquat-inducible protein B